MELVPHIPLISRKSPAEELPGRGYRLKRAYDLFRSEDNRPRANPRPARDRPKSQTFAICAKMALPLQLPLNSKRPVRVEMYWNGRKRKGVRPFLASTFMGSLKLRQNVEGSNSKSDGQKRKTIPLGFWLVCALTD